MAGSGTFPVRVPLDLTLNELRNAIVQVLASAPTGIGGRIYSDSTLDSPYWYSATRSAWIPLDATKATGIPITGLAAIAAGTIVGNNTGGSAVPTALTASQVKTLLAIVPADISGFDTQVRTSRLDQMSAPTASVNLNSQKITNLLDPTNPQDAASKNYVDTAIQTAASGLDPKDAVNAATTANITLSGPQTIDGVSVVAGNRVLVKNQTTAADNGIYQCNAGTWTRTPDAVQGTLTAGALMLVLAGTAQAGSQWYLNTPDPIIVGTTSLSFIQFGAGGAYAAGNGLTLTGSTFAVGAGTGIVVSTGVTAIDTAVVARKYATTIGNGSATSFTITHGLATSDILVQIINLTTGDIEQASVNVPNTSTCTIVFSVAPTTNQYRVLVHG